MFTAELVHENEIILSYKKDEFIPASLHSFILKQLGNAFIEEYDYYVGNKASMAIAHLIPLKTVKKERKPGAKGGQHPRCKEASLPLYVGLKLHSLFSYHWVLTSVLHSMAPLQQLLPIQFMVQAYPSSNILIKKSSTQVYSV